MKNNFLKKMTTVILALIMVFSTLAITACGGDGGSGSKLDPEEGRSSFIEGIGGVSETFEGAVSAESYESADDAAAAYVQEELAGKSEATVTNVVSKGEVALSTLKLPEELAAGAEAVEELEVSYDLAIESIEAEEGFVLLAGEKLNKSYTVKVYVIKYENDWKYYSPCPETGDTISKSYYDSVFDFEKYKNCTLVSTSKIKADTSVKAAGQSMSGTMELTMIQTIKHDGNKVILEQEVIVDELSGMFEMTGNPFGNAGKLSAYLEEDETGNISCYIKQNGEWYLGALTGIGFTRIEELTPFYDQYLDYTYFTKADFGFTLRDENAQQYIKESLGDILDAFVGETGNGTELDMYSEYYVSEGVLSGMRCTVDVSLDFSAEGQSMKMDETVEQTITCTNYGTTVVEKPFDE